MLNNPVGWFEIHVKNMPRARAFYQAVFQVELTPLNATEFEMWAFPADMTRYGAGGALIKIDGAPSGCGGTLVYFSCDDCTQEAQRVLEAGGKIHRPKTAIGEYGFIVLCVDSEDNLIGLHSRR